MPLGIASLVVARNLKGILFKVHSKTHPAAVQHHAVLHALAEGQSSLSLSTEFHEAIIPTDKSLRPWEGGMIGDGISTPSMDTGQNERNFQEGTVLCPPWPRESSSSSSVPYAK
jgi:hypothetical protein